MNVDPEEQVTVEQLRRVAYGKEASPVTGWSAWWVTMACARLEHPTKRDTDPTSAPCVCGKRS